MNTLFRRAVLKVAALKSVRSWFQRYGMRMGVRRFVAAETLDGVVEQVKRMNNQGLSVTLDYLGESITEPALADAAAGQIIRVLKTIHEHKLDAHVSVKLSQLGFQSDPQLGAKHMRRITAAAQYFNSFVRIDMEDSSLTEATLQLFESLVEHYGTRHIGCVIQAYLYRSVSDMKRLNELRANVRIVKGAYREPVEIAFARKTDVDRQYMELVRLHLAGGHYTAVATHDERLISVVKAFTSQSSIPKSQFEFQMLYGIGNELQQQLAGEGYRVRVYTPFGKEWYAYYSRRIAERPANLWFVIKGMLRK